MTKKIIISISLIILALFIGCSQKEQIQQIDVMNYDITLGFPSPREIAISAIVSCNVPGNTSQIEFLLNPAVSIHSIRMQHNETWTEVSFDRNETAIQLSIPDSLATIDPTIRFDYIFPLEQPLGNFFYIDRGYRWYPLIIDDVAKVRIAATVFQGYSMFSCGDLVDERVTDNRSTYVWETQIPVFKIPVVLIMDNNYTEVSTPCADSEISFYVLNENPETDPHIAGEACAMFNFCESMIGTYPHKKLTFIETATFNDMSFIASGLVLIGSDIMGQFRQRQTQGLHLPIAMQWFGSGVFATFQDDGFWFFSLSLPHYVRLMAVQRFEGNEAFTKGLSGPYDMYLVYADTDDDIPVVDVDMLDSPAKGYAITGKGPLIFDRLRREIGEEQWVKFLQDLYANYIGKTMTYEEFIDDLSDFADPKLVKKFDKMIRSKGELRQ